MGERDEPKAPESTPAPAGGASPNTPPRTPHPTIQLDLGKMRELVAEAGLKSNQVRRFGDYELLEGIAQGGMGAIYKARQLKLNRTVALKTILSGMLAGEDQMKRFRAEAEAVANLDHPNIVPIYEVGEHEGQLFFSMRFIEGGSLDDQMKRFVADPQASAILMAKVARAVHFAHQHGILHRDLKPDNILLDNQGEPHITDFGLAKRVDAGENLTVTGEIIGTPNYMSPEQAEGKGFKLTTAVDVYGLGAVLYQLLTGHPPFRAESPLETLRLVIDREPQRPSAINRRVDRDLETICLKCMEKDPQRRYGSAEAVAEDIERWLRKEPIRARPAGYFYRAGKWAARRPAVALLAVTTFAGLCTLFGVILVNEQRLQKERDIALGLEKTATQERLKAEALAEQSRQRLVRLNIGDGLRLMDEGDASAALLSFVDALRLDEGNKENAEIQRTRIASALRQAPRLIQFWTEDQPIVASAASVNGRFLVTFAGKRARLWDVSTGVALGQPVPLPDNVRSAAVSPDGQQLLLLNDNRTALLWNWRKDKSHPIKLAHDFPVNVATFSADGKLVAIAGGQNQNGTARVWSTANGEPVTKSIRIPDDVDAITFSADGTKLAVASRDRTATVWNTQTGQAIGKPLRHGGIVRHVSFSPDGLRLVTASEDRTARVWNVMTGEPITPPLQHNDIVTYAEFSPDGTRVATANKDNTGRVWDANTGEPVTPPLAHSTRVARVRFSPDGRRVLTVAEKSARVWDATSGKPITPPLAHNAEILHALFNPDGRSIMIASKDRTIRVWDTPAAQQNSRELAIKGELRQTIFSKDNRLMLAVTDNTLRVWDVTTGEPASQVFNSSGEILAARFVNNDSAINAISSDQTVRSWEIKTGMEKRNLRMPFSISFAAFSPDNKILFTADMDRKGQLRSIPTVEPTQPPGGPGNFKGKRREGTNAPPFTGKAPMEGPSPAGDRSGLRPGNDNAKSIEHKSRIAYAQFSADSTKVVTASWDSTARVWDATTGKAITPPLEHSDRVVLASFSPDGTKVVTASWDNTARIWDASTGKPLSPPLEHTAELTLASFSPDGRFVVTASADNTARIWNAATGEAVTPFLQHNGWVVAATFSPDSTRVVTASWDNTARIWDTYTGAPVTPPLLHRDRVDHASFTQDGRILFTASADGTTRLWDFTPDARPIDDIAPLAQLLSGRRLDNTGSLVPVSATRLAENWDTLRQKYPQQFSINQDEIVAWHSEEAEVCEQTQSWFAALFHLNWLVDEKPNDSALKKRRDTAQTKLREASASSSSP
ncbi:MAG: repeat-containing protein [Verrucomicrobia bacterium]|jgi:WD40 repeat protein/tRNA A-37 threonylcarbamoyl transferase component Bud32|nr:repeat-containing protein [Verrucomicrobiota bacterium]